MQISYPSYSPRIKKEEEKEYIFDTIRKQWVRLTPEEWVRQNFLQYLIIEKKIPPALIAVEKEIKVGELKKRFDILIYKDSLPWMIIECKEQQTQLNDAVIKQVLQYYSAIKSDYLVVTNGEYTHAFHINNSHINELQEIPCF